MYVCDNFSMLVSDLENIFRFTSNSPT
jgi:hypothetical protein